MQIQLNKVSKRYSDRWVIKDCTLSLSAGQTYALVGPNGSGKSTLIKLLSGFLSPTKGSITYTHNNLSISRDDIFKYVTMAAPYASMLKQLTLKEMIELTGRFKSYYGNCSTSEFLDILQIDALPDTMLKDLSSGQFQKFGLAAALLTQSDILLLDEPGSFLDENAKLWFHSLLRQYTAGRLVVIASNDPADLVNTDKSIRIEDFK